MAEATAGDVTEIDRIGHREAMSIATVENRKFADLLGRLGPRDWTRPTDCVAWDGRALAAHVVGSAAAQASPREFYRQVRAGRPFVAETEGGHFWDGMNEVQIRERASMTTAELRSEWDTMSVKAVRARTKMPRLIARLPVLALPEPIGRQPLGYLFDMGFTRDTWMHRIDLARATGQPLDLDAAHDGRIVADLVAEWAGTHGEPFSLDLSGPAGGHYRATGSGDQAVLQDVEHVAMDAIELCRILAERGHGEGVLGHPLPL
jgi:uncharacterized protein (TIGR03083 family)